MFYKTCQILWQVWWVVLCSTLPYGICCKTKDTAQQTQQTILQTTLMAFSDVLSDQPFKVTVLFDMQQNQVNSQCFKSATASKKI